MPDGADPDDDLETQADGASPSIPPRKRPEKKEDEDAETLASVPRGDETAETIVSIPDEGDAGDEPATSEVPTGTVPGPAGPTGDLLDLESVPARPARPRDLPGLSRPAPSPAPPGATRPPAPGDVTQSELPTLEVDVGRDVDTQVGGFGAEGTETPGRAKRKRDDDEPFSEEATVADAGLTERQKALLSGPGSQPGSKTDRTPSSTEPGLGGASAAGSRSPGPVPASKFSRGTARDPVAGSAALRGTTPGARAAPTVLREGMLLADRYELVRRLGKGGMGEVWQARHTLLQGMRAIKLIKASISRDPSFRARFLSEGQTMMRVKHPGVVEVTDLDETRQNRELFMVMEYLQGRTLHEAVRNKEAPLDRDLRNVARIYRELALGMQRIHDERIVHKDLKTDNVLLVKGEDGLEHPKVIDFGLAKRLDDQPDTPTEHKAGEGAAGEGGTGEGGTGGSTDDPDLRTTLSGTLAYMAPEQFAGRPSSFQSDLYSFGVMLYECFQKGEYPMPRGTLVEYMDRHRKGVVPKRLRAARPDLDPFVAELADRCMAPAREARPESFREVADQLQWWLDIPVRAARRKRMALLSGTAALLIGAVVYLYFFGGRQYAGFGGIQLSRLGGTEQLQSHAGRTYLPDGCLAALEVTGTVSGTPPESRPQLLVDGVAHEADLVIESREGRTVLAGTLDLSDLPDGPHELGFRAEPGADPSTVRIVIDRTRPRIEKVQLPGDETARITNADNPGLWIRLDTTQDELRDVRVKLVAQDRSVLANPDPNDPSRWTVTGVHEESGPSRVQVTARDLAGNVSEPAEFEFTRDLVPPACEIVADGLVEDVLQVRSPSGNRVKVTSAEPVRVRREFLPTGASVADAVERGPGQEFELDLPQIPAAGAVVTLVAKDEAGNEWTRRLTAKVVADVAALSPPGAPSERRLAVRSGEATVLLLHRTYPLPAGVVVTRARLRDAQGEPVQPAPAPTAVPGAVVEVDPRKPTDAQVRLPAAFDPGAWSISLAGVTGAAVEPLVLTVDPGAPVVEEVVVRDASGKAVPRGAWCLTEDAVVEVAVRDLSLVAVTLGGAEPAEPPVVGAGRYTFRVRLAEQGANSLALVAVDAVDQRTSQSVEVRADWTDPVVTLRRPQADEGLDDTRPVTFEGTCSEPRFRLVLAGIGDMDRAQQQNKPEFTAEWTLPAGEHDVQVRAIDEAGRSSAPVPLHLSVAKVERDQPPQIDWTEGTASVMRKVERGAVVIEGRTHPVARVYLDRTEVTNRQYRDFLAACAAHGAGRAPWDHADQPAGWSHVPPAETWNDAAWNGDDLPVVNVSYWDAYAYAKWTGRRLPTEAEWVKAAALGEGEAELRSWPPIASGGAWKEGLIVTAESSGQKGPADVTSGGDVSPSGCLHMGGNVSEWVERPLAAAGEPRTGVRGGSFWTTRFGADLRRVPTKAYDPSFRSKTIGIRCAKDASEVRR